MNFKGNVIAILEAKTGISKTTGNEWKSQDIVVEEAGAQYPASVVVSNFNDKVRLPAIGDFVEVHINPQVNEWQGRYFQKLTVWKLDVITPVNPQQQTPPYGQPLPQPTPPVGANTDDLPF